MLKGVCARNMSMSKIELLFNLVESDDLSMNSFGKLTKPFKKIQIIEIFFYRSRYP